MATTKTIVSMLESAARAVAEAREFGCSTTCGAVGLHGVTLEQAAELMAAGYRPTRWTEENRWDTDGWRTRYDLQGVVDGVAIVLFTVGRPSTAWEILEEGGPIDVLAPPPVVEPSAVEAVIEVTPPRPVICTESRWSFLEVD